MVKVNRAEIQVELDAIQPALERLSRQVDASASLNEDVDLGRVECELDAITARIRELAASVS